eukprot:30957-Pelagococcus_subviridis.AAC.3
MSAFNFTRSVLGDGDEASKASTVSMTSRASNASPDSILHRAWQRSSFARPGSDSSGDDFDLALAWKSREHWNNLSATIQRSH